MYLRSLSSHTPTLSLHLVVHPHQNAPHRNLHTRTDCALRTPGPTWQQSLPVRLCVQPFSQHIRILFPLEKKEAGPAKAPQNFHSASTGRKDDGCQTAGICQLMSPKLTITRPTTTIQAKPGRHC